MKHLRCGLCILFHHASSPACDFYRSLIPCLSCFQLLCPSPSFSLSLPLFPIPLSAYPVDGVEMEASSANAVAVPGPVPEHKHIWVICGPSGCGKTSVAEYLHLSFAIPYLEGDTVS